VRLPERRVSLETLYYLSNLTSRDGNRVRAVRPWALPFPWLLQAICCSISCTTMQRGHYSARDARFAGESIGGRTLFRTALAAKG
jgi:hypothetical protein